MNEKIKIVFIGSGPVAAKSLSLLVNDFEIEAIITKPRANHHKGTVPVIDVASQLAIPFYTVSNKNELDELITEVNFKSLLAILIDFGIIVSPFVIDSFPRGIVNSHFSILPEWRGADPITFSILSGQETTGVSLMLLDEKMDEGPLLAYDEYKLTGNITSTVLTHDLIQLSHTLIKKTVPAYLAQKTRLIDQDKTGKDVSYSRKLTKADGIIDWKKPAEVIEREVRAFNEWPRSRTTIFSKDVVLTGAHVAKKIKNTQNIDTPQPKLAITDDNKIAVKTGQDYLVIDRIIPSGKKEMSIQDFLRGYWPNNLRT